MNRKERRRLEKLRRRGASPDAAVGGGEDAFVPAALEQGGALLQAGRPDEALRMYRQVLEVRPDHADALNLGGVAAFQAGDVKGGLRMLRAAAARRPDHPDTLNNLGNVLRAAGRPEDAEASYRQALGADPGAFDGHYNLGILLESMGRPGEARASYRRATEIRPQFADAQFSLGNAAKALGRLDEALAAYGRAIEIDPGHADAHNNLGSALRELGRLEEAADACRRALAIDRGHADAHYNLGVVLQDLEKLDEAAAAYRDALAARPGHVPALVNLGYALHGLGRLDDAIEAYRRAIAAAPEYAGAHVNLGDAYLDRGEPRAALEVCEAYLEAHPGDSGMLAFQGIVLGELGDRAAVRALVDFDRFVRPVRFAGAQGFASLVDFNAALADHVCAHPTLVSAPASHATRKGKHSGELLVEPKGPVAVLETMIRGAVEDYARSLPRDPAHPFLARPPRRFGLAAWGVVMESQGHQIPHVHPSAWLSGVYYVRLPGVIAAPGEGRAGWIEFGRPPEHFHCAAEPEVRSIRPEEGLMLLFPSYVYHHTVPFDSAETRISIAFDVLRAG